MERERIDEALELLWLLDEEGHSELERFRLSSDDPAFEDLLDTLIQEGLISIAGSTVRLSERGRVLSKGLIRRHRLAERLFTDVFELKNDQVETDACMLEHILSEQLTDSVCAFLGHPPTCPHGKPIPKGECCKKYKAEIKPVVMRLPAFEVGARGRIVFIIPSEASRLNRLGSVGIAAGSGFKLIQKTPSFVIQVDETTIALDPDIAKEIFVKKTGNETR
ncbi:MAG TPA: DtxR family transcriptional regulator [Nitrospiraceae bacterium]|jgi:DtxR family Mn-dependent transcriptional regulator|nr:DtxR family transcriptional regulator [Nitrospiraceae bacterium]